MEGGGGLGGECRQQSQRQQPLACSADSRCLPQPYPPPSQDRVYRPPSHPRGGDAPGGEGWVQLGRERLNPPSPFPHLYCALDSGRGGGAQQAYGWGGGVMGVFRKLRLLVGGRWHPVPAPPPPLHSRNPSHARSGWNLGWRGGGGGGEDQGIVGPFSTPLPLVPPRRKKALGKGGWRGG